MGYLHVEDIIYMYFHVINLAYIYNMQHAQNVVFWMWFLNIKYDKITHVADHKTIPLQLLGLSSGQLHEIKFRSNWYLLISFHARLFWIARQLTVRHKQNLEHLEVSISI